MQPAGASIREREREREREHQFAASIGLGFGGPQRDGRVGRDARPSVTWAGAHLPCDRACPAVGTCPGFRLWLWLRLRLRVVRARAVSRWSYPGPRSRAPSSMDPVHTEAPDRENETRGHRARSLPRSHERIRHSARPHRAARRLAKASRAYLEHRPRAAVAADRIVEALGRC